MKLSKGVEWGVHCVTLLAQVEGDATLSRRMLAEQYDLPEMYLAKQLQSLVRAGILQATSGPKGGFRLAGGPEEITVLDVVEAIDGVANPFVCEEIRQRGKANASPEECLRPCGINRAMSAAYQAWRSSLRSVTIADIVRDLPESVRSRNRARLSTG